MNICQELEDEYGESCMSCEYYDSMQHVCKNEKFRGKGYIDTDEKCEEYKIGNF